MPWMQYIKCSKNHYSFHNLVRSAGLEPAAFSFGGRRSNPLSYERKYLTLLGLNSTTRSFLSITTVQLFFRATRARLAFGLNAIGFSTKERNPMSDSVSPTPMDFLRLRLWLARYRTMSSFLYWDGAWRILSV